MSRSRITWFRAVTCSAALFVAFLCGCANRAFAQVPVLYYDFENNTTRTTFENAVEAAINAGSGPLARVGSAASVTGAGGAGIFNGGTAAGSAAQSDQWSSAASDPGGSATEYFQLVANAQGLAGLVVTLDDQASSDGPAAVGVAYSTDGVNFTSVATQATSNAAFSSHTFSLPAAVDDQGSITIRIYAYADGRTGRAAFASSGTYMIDNLSLQGATILASKTLLDYNAIANDIRPGGTAVISFGGLAITGAGTTA